jgi:hypothetical protein
MINVSVVNEQSKIIITPSSPGRISVKFPGPSGPPGPQGEIGETGAPGPGLPTGGELGQIIEKSGVNDYETSWTSNPTFESIQFQTDHEVAVEPGQLAWDFDNKTLAFGKGGGVSLQIGQEQVTLCRNSTNSAIANGRAVMFAGTVGASGRLLVAPMIADGSLPGYVFFGIATQNIESGEDGFVTSFGKVGGINTTQWLDGTILWCDPIVPGGLTAVEPEAPNLKLAVAAVVSSKNNGTLMVRWDTGRRLQDLHDVEANGLKSDNDVLSWNESANRWESVAPSSISPDSLEELIDVDASEKQDNSVLYYNLFDQKWKGDDVNTLVSLTDGGNF